jgi:hypothetical protein
MDNKKKSYLANMPLATKLTDPDCYLVRYCPHPSSEVDFFGQIKFLTLIMQKQRFLKNVFEMS